MAGVGRAPKDPGERIGHEEPGRGDWRATPGSGWQHGEAPACPARGSAAAETWETWMAAWYAAHWTPSDLPVLRLVIKLWVKADSGKATGAERSELRQLMDSMGITPKGQADRRWKRPQAGAPGDRPSAPRASRATSPASHLSVVPDADR